RFIDDYNLPQYNLYRPFSWIIQIKNTCEICIPVCYSIKQRESSQRWLLQWKDNLPENLQLISPIDDRSLDQFFRNAPEKLTHHNQIKRTDVNRYNKDQNLITQK